MSKHPYLLSVTSTLEMIYQKWLYVALEDIASIRKKPIIF